MFHHRIFLLRSVLDILIWHMMDKQSSKIFFDCGVLKSCWCLLQYCGTIYVQDFNISIHLLHLIKLVKILHVTNPRICSTYLRSFTILLHSFSSVTTRH